jgi:hypothetical protein
MPALTEAEARRAGTLFSVIIDEAELRGERPKPTAPPSESTASGRLGTRESVEIDAANPIIAQTRSYVRIYVLDAISCEA